MEPCVCKWQESEHHFQFCGLSVISKDDIEDGDTVKVCQLGSNDTIFRSSNEITYADPDVKAETEGPTEGTENTGDNN